MSTMVCRECGNDCSAYDPADFSGLCMVCEAAEAGELDDDMPDDLFGEDPGDDTSHLPAPGKSYEEYVASSRGKTMDDIMAEAAARVAKPPEPLSEEEDEDMSKAAAEAADKALTQGHGVCPACGSDNLEAEPHGVFADQPQPEPSHLVCRDCGARTSVGARIWQVVEPEGRHACCSELCAKVGARRVDGDVVPPIPWQGDVPEECFGCGGEILTTDGGS